MKQDATINWQGFTSQQRSTFSVSEEMGEFYISLSPTVVIEQATLPHLKEIPNKKPPNYSAR